MYSMKSVGDFLKEKRNQKGYSLRELGNLADVNHSHISDVEKGSKEPTLKWMMKVVNALSIDLNELMRETGFLPPDAEPVDKKKIKSVPVLSWTQCGNWKAMGEESFDEYIDTDANGEFALKVRGDSMEPVFFEGDIIIINPYLKQEHGDYIVVANHEGEATLKQLKKVGKNRVLHPLNSKYEDIVLNKEIQYRVIGVVVEKKTKFR